MARAASSLWNGPTARTLRDVYGGERPIFFHFLDKVQEFHLEVGGRPPFDPYRFASMIGVQVLDRDISVDGLLEQTSDKRLVVYLKRSASHHRKRFTLSHELAHAFFYDILAPSRHFRGKSSYDIEEERLCDMAAAQLLMPFSTFSQDLRSTQNGSGVTPSILLQLMSRYEVSLQAVAIRTAWLTRNTICALWERDGNAINMKWVTPQSLRPFVLCQTGKSSVEIAFGRRGEVFGRDSFYCPRLNGRMLRRKTASLAFQSGQVLSVSTAAGGRRGRGQLPQAAAGPADSVAALK